MPHSLSPTDARMLADLEAEVRPLVATVRTALADTITAPGPDGVARMLTAAPVDACVRLADAWAVACAVGLRPDRVKARLDPEDQFVIDLVTSVYTAARPGVIAHPDLPELARLLDEAGADLCETVGG